MRGACARFVGVYVRFACRSKSPTFEFMRYPGQQLSNQQAVKHRHVVAANNSLVHTVKTTKNPPPRGIHWFGPPAVGHSPHPTTSRNINIASRPTTHLQISVARSQEIQSSAVFHLFHTDCSTIACSFVPMCRATPVRVGKQELHQTYNRDEIVTANGRLTSQHNTVPECWTRIHQSHRARIHTHLYIANAAAALSAPLTMPQERLLSPLLRHRLGNGRRGSQVLRGLRVESEHLSSQCQEELHGAPQSESIF